MSLKADITSKHKLTAVSLCEVRGILLIWCGTSCYDALRQRREYMPNKNHKQIVAVEDVFVNEDLSENER